MPMERFGDANAPRWMSPALERSAIPIGVAVCAFAVIVIVIAAWQAFESGVGVRLVGLFLGLGIGALIIVAVLFFWLRYWRRLKNAVRQVSIFSPASVVIGGRIPQLAREATAIAWPDFADPVPVPQQIVLVADGTGLEIVSVTHFPQLIGSSSWQEILDIRPVEYVEAGRAYEGLAIIGSTASRSVVLQVVNVGRVAVSFPRGTALEGIANLLRSQKPSVPGSSEPA